MSLTSHLLSLSTSTPYDAATKHEFLTLAGNGTLDNNRLAFWLAQDRIYAAHAYPRFIGSLIAHIPYNSFHPTQSAEELLNQRILKTLVFCLDNVIREVAFFTQTSETWGLDLSVWNERKETRDYTAEMARISAGTGIEDGLVFLWAMEKVYLDAWTYVHNQLGSTGGPIAAFATNWSSPEFAAFVDDLANLVDSLGILPGWDAWKRAEGIWARVVELEETFWPRKDEEKIQASRSDTVTSITPTG